jgi:hypothetical protein
MQRRILLAVHPVEDKPSERSCGNPRNHRHCPLKQTEIVGAREIRVTDLGGDSHKNGDSGKPAENGQTRASYGQAVHGHSTVCRR